MILIGHIDDPCRVSSRRPPHEATRHHHPFRHSEYLTFVAASGDSPQSVEMRYEDDNIWLTQKMMATLYNVDVRTINDHIKKIYVDSKLLEGSTIRKYRNVRTDGERQISCERL